MATASTYSPTDSNASISLSWQERLEEICRQAKLLPPVFQLVSDRRGGRTAWSSRVIVHGKTVEARYWYDGKNLNNAREDAAECAFNWLSASSTNSSSQSWGSC
ncbi:hypothetical protein JDV02_008488 [Purpureocillium takamizusanense]|uniref:DRBM domain-containing protein n=1 Tax=Purpureocillium takamizusanense TaxID=2060973 RepID=A0A9Q8QM68_9HYPO|nr:uncharacterized protein JDV02_008488 [Purpureocillium takamizusanense]UNI22618.1 hypothetical protein JDV02_008488 [Purpureocillium takamizusanense]